MGLIITYIALISYFVIIPSLGNITTDPIRFLLATLLVLIPLYIVVVLVQYKRDGMRRDLTHIVFVILVGLSVSLLLTLQNEWVPRSSIESNIFFSNMSVSIDRISPLTIPIRSIAPSSPDSIYPLRVKIYNYTPIEPVSVSMTPPPNTVFWYDKFERDNITDSDAYDEILKRYVYRTDIKASHTGQVFNSTDEYVVNIDYRVVSNLSNDMNLSKQPLTKNFTSLPIGNITATNPVNRSNTIDNNINTKWSAEGDGQSISYIFGNRYNVSKVAIAFFKGDVRQNFFEINGQQFNSSGKTTKLENFTLKMPILNTDSLQIIGHGNSGGGDSKVAYNAFSEVKVYAETPYPTGKSAPTVAPASDPKVYRNSVPFQWTIKMTDLSLTTYFWIVMAGVVTSRFMSLILDKVERHHKHGDQDTDFQIINWRDGLGILFSFIIALILFSSFKQQAASLTTIVLFNISIAFAFGFGFDKTLEVAPRFSPKYKANERETETNGNSA